MQSMMRELLVGRLQDVTRLVDLYERREPTFVDNVIRWLSDTEQSLLRLRSPIAAMIASERGLILAASDGYRSRQIAGEGSTLRHARRATAMLALSRAEAAMRGKVEVIDTHFAGMREKMAQLLAVASGIQPIELSPSGNGEAWLMQVWRQVSSHEETKGMARYLAASLASTDRLYILRDVLSDLLEGAVNGAHG